MFLEVLRMTTGTQFRKFHLWVVIEVRSRRYNTLTRIFDNLQLYCKKKYINFSRYRPDVAQRVGKGIALLFHDRGTRRG